LTDSTRTASRATRSIHSIEILMAGRTTVRLPREPPRRHGGPICPRGRETTLCFTRHKGEGFAVVL
jgi:hypothetical protein